MTNTTDAPGLAALAICESILIALEDHKVLPGNEILGILVDAAASHSSAPNGTDATDTHSAVAALIQTIITNRKSARPN